MSSNLIDVALWYAERMGWAVVPIHTPNEDGSCSCGVKSCGSVGKHPRTRNGSSEATTDRSTIRDWWRQWPDANIGIATGKINDLVVIDVDPRNGGLRTLKELEQVKRVPRTLLARTGGGGYHYFCQYPERDVNFKVGRGVDMKSDGGFVVAMPSKHVSGNEYEWIKPPKTNVRLRPLPSWATIANGTRKGALVAPGEVLRNGNRNSGLTSIAGRLRRAGMDEFVIGDALMGYNRQYCEPPLDEREVRLIARSVSRYDTPTQKIEQEIARQDNPDALLPYTELGHAKRLLRLHGEDIRFVSGLGWLIWNGKVWQQDKMQRIRLFAYDVSKDIREEAVGLGLEEKDLHAALRKADEAESHRVTSALLGQLAALEDVAESIERFDSDPMMLNVQNGTIDLTTGIMREHSRDDYLTKMAPVFYDRAAKAPRFQQFLKETFMDDVDLIAYMQRLLGYCLTGLVSEQVFPIFWGKGGNGKGTLVEEVMTSILGTDYLTVVPASVLRAKNFSGHPTELTGLRGARMATVSESSARLDEEMIKRLTGGDTITARYMHQNFFSFKPTHTLVLLTNNKPRTSSGDAIWRRLQLVPFEYKPKPEDIDKQLDEKLRAESSGILNWLIKGCLLWQRDGLNPPDKIIATTEAHRESEDVFGMFLTECVTFNNDAKVLISRLYAAYSMWCLTNSAYKLGKIRFIRELLERNTDITKRVSNGQTRLHGLKLLGK